MALDKYEHLVNQFPAVTAEEWKSKISKDLKGEPFDKLIWHTQENIEVLPFYTNEDIQKYQLHIPQKSTSTWQIVERVEVISIEEANKIALHALENGATSILFNLKCIPISDTQIQTLIQQILLDIAPVYFENFVPENKTILEKFVPNSGIYRASIPEQHTITEELVWALQKGIEHSATHFHFYIRQNYFFEIAKLRAFRWLWNQICALKGLDNSIQITAETSITNFSKEDENYNILRNTTAAMSAIIGGCDTLIINPHDIQNSSSGFGKRIARNIQHILQHESYFSELQDAAKGTYYIEYLTYMLSKNAWEKFNA